MDDSEMASLPTGVSRLGSIFRLRVGIPQDIQHLYPRLPNGKPQTDRYRASLRTSDPAVARVRASALWATFDAEFHQKRTTFLTPKLAAIPKALRTVIADSVYAAEMIKDAERRRDRERTTRIAAGVSVQYVEVPEDADPLTFDVADQVLASRDVPAGPKVSKLAPLDMKVVEARAALNQRRLETVKTAVAAHDLLAMVPIVEPQLQRLGLVVDYHSDDAVLMLEDALSAYLRARTDVVDGDKGKSVETPTLPAPVAGPNAPVPAKALHLRDVVADWKAAKKPTVDSIERTERALRHLEASGQDKPLRELKRSHGAAVRAWLLHDDREFGSKTALNYWQALSALMNVARDVGLIDLSPWQGMTFEVTGSKKRKPFTDEELQHLFGTSLHKEGTWPVVAKVDPWDAYFCTLMLLWTGARVGELAQLEVVDVQMQNGLMVFSIHEEAEGSTVKGGSGSASVRTLPLADDLIRLGFLDRVEDLRKRGETKLFPSFHRPGAVTPGEIMSEWFRPFRATIGAATGALNGTHRFRHTIRTRLNALQVPEATADALTGHATQGSVGRSVYTTVDPSTIQKDMAPLTWPMEFPRVYGITG